MVPLAGSGMVGGSYMLCQQSVSPSLAVWIDQDCLFLSKGCFTVGVLDLIPTLFQSSTYLCHMIFPLYL